MVNTSLIEEELRNIKHILLIGLVMRIYRRNAKEHEVRILNEIYEDIRLRAHMLPRESEEDEEY